MTQPRRAPSSKASWCGGAPKIPNSHDVAAKFFYSSPPTFACSSHQSLPNLPTLLYPRPPRSDGRLLAPLHPRSARVHRLLRNRQRAFGPTVHVCEDHDAERCVSVVPSDEYIARCIECFRKGNPGNNCRADSTLHSRLRGISSAFRASQRKSPGNIWLDFRSKFQRWANTFPNFRRMVAI